MITVSKNSQFYKYLNSSFVAELADLTPRVPDNLCSFMRRVVFYFCFETFLFTIAAVMVIVPLLAVLVNFFLPGFFQQPFISLGIVWWTIIFLCFTTYFVKRYAGESVKKATKRVAAKGSIQTMAAWFHAIHDKVCPRLKFEEGVRD